MPIVVIAKTPEDYAKWIDETEAKQIAEQKRQQELLDMEMSMDELMAMGEKIYNSTCAACHQPNGQGISGTFLRLQAVRLRLSQKISISTLILFCTVSKDQRCKLLPSN